MLLFVVFVTTAENFFIVFSMRFEAGTGGCMCDILVGISYMT